MTSPGSQRPPETRQTTPSAAPANPPGLEVRDLSIAFAGLQVLDRVSFAVPQGCIAGLIGPNGAGKSTLLNCISRLYQPDRGEILYEGDSLLGCKVHELAGRGIRRTFQNLELFRAASVRENLVLGGAGRDRAGLLAELLGLRAAQRSEERAVARAERLLESLGLAAFAEARVADLPYGVQKTVELARALASAPRLLLLDEPAAGMNEEESRRLGATLRRLRDEQNLTILLVEHDMTLVMTLCEHLVVLDHGEKIAEGVPDLVRRTPAVVAAYLGGEEDDA